MGKATVMGKANSDDGETTERGSADRITAYVDSVDVDGEGQNQYEWYITKITWLINGVDLGAGAE